MTAVPGSGPEPDRLARAREALVAAERTAAADAPRRTDLPTESADQIDTDAYTEAKRIVLRQLTVAPRTRHQLAEKLRQRGCEPEVSAAVLDRMSEVGLVDDEAYARMFVRSRQESKGLAARALTQELRDKGVAEEYIDAALVDVDTDAEFEKARALVAKRIGGLRGLDREVQIRRLAGFLGRKGYDGSVAYRVINEALDQIPEHQRD